MSGKISQSSQDDFLFMFCVLSMNDLTLIAETDITGEKEVLSSDFFVFLRVDHTNEL